MRSFGLESERWAAKLGYLRVTGHGACGEWNRKFYSKDSLQGKWKNVNLCQKSIWSSNIQIVNSLGSNAVFRPTLAFLKCIPSFIWMRPVQQRSVSSKGSENEQTKPIPISHICNRWLCERNSVFLLFTLWLSWQKIKQLMPTFQTYNILSLSTMENQYFSVWYALKLVDLLLKPNFLNCSSRLTNIWHNTHLPIQHLHLF